MINPNHPANRLEKTWKKRTSLMDLLVNYSDSINQIVAAGQSSKNTANELIDSVSDLAVVLPGGETFSNEPAALARTLLRAHFCLRAFSRGFTLGFSMSALWAFVVIPGCMGCLGKANA